MGNTCACCGDDDAGQQVTMTTATLAAPPVDAREGWHAPVRHQDVPGSLLAPQAVVQQGDWDQPAFARQPSEGSDHEGMLAPPPPLPPPDDDLDQGWAEPRGERGTTAAAAFTTPAPKEGERAPARLVEETRRDDPNVEEKEAAAGGCQTVPQEMPLAQCFELGWAPQEELRTAEPSQAVPQEMPLAQGFEKDVKPQEELRKAEPSQDPAAPQMLLTFWSPASDTRMTVAFGMRPLGIDFNKRIPITIKGVREGSWAAMNGVEVGQQLVAVDGQELSGMSIPELHHILMVKSQALPPVPTF